MLKCSTKVFEIGLLRGEKKDRMIILRQGGSSAFHSQRKKKPKVNGNVEENIKGTF